MKKRPKKKRQSKRGPNSNYILREYRPVRFDENKPVPEKFVAFAKEHLFPHIKFSRQAVARQHSLALAMLHQLICAGVATRATAIRDSRDTGIKGSSTRITVWEALQAAEFCQPPCKGSQISDKETRYAATEKLLETSKEWRLNMLDDRTLTKGSEAGEIEEASPLDLVFIKPGRVNRQTGVKLTSEERSKRWAPLAWFKRLSSQHLEPGEAEQLISAAREAIHQQEECMEAINASSRKFRVTRTRRTASGFTQTVDVWVYLQQSHTEAWNSGVRYYTSGEFGGQSIPREERPTIRVDGEEIAEFDFSCMHIRMLYHKVGAKPQGDIYRVPDVFPKAHKSEPEEHRRLLRRFVKLAVNACLNVSNRLSALRMLNNMLYDGSSKARAKAISEGKKVGKKKEPPFSAAERRILRDLLINAENLVNSFDKVDVETILTRIERIHAVLYYNYFYKEHVGPMLMTIESQIMGRVLLEFLFHERFILPMHDGLICKRSDAEFAEATMRECYRLHTGFLPEITRAM